MKWYSERGSALLLTVVVVVVLLFLVGSLGVIAMVESRMAQREELAMQAYYLACSGADAVAQYIIDNPEKYGNIRENYPSKPVSFNRSADGHFTVKVTPATSKLLIESHSVIGDQQRVVLLTLEIGLLGYFTHAIVGLGETLDLKGLQLEGTIAAYPDTDVTGYSKDVIRIPTGSFPEIVFPSERKPTRPASPPTANNLTIDTALTAAREFYYDTISGTLTINLSDEDVIIGVRKLDVSSIKINHSGVEKKGRVLLFVEEEFMSGGGAYALNWNETSMPDPRILTIYYSGIKEFATKNDGQKINGNIVVEKAAVNLNGGKVNGNFFTLGKSVALAGNPLQNSLIYAPNATVKITGTVQMGSLIAEQIVAGGDAKVIFPYSEDSKTGYVDTFPQGIFGEDYDFSTEESGYKRGTWSTVR